MAGRRIALAAVMLAIIAVTLAACGPVVAPEADSISVYATYYPIYALTDAVMRDIPDAELHCLVQPQDGCLRDYQLSDWDIRLLAAAGAVISGGRGLESFESMLFSWGDKGPAVSAVLYNLELYNQGKGSGDSERESHLEVENPHLYMSMEGAEQIVQSISAMLMSLDPRYAEKYVSNTDAALESLRELARRAREIMDPWTGRRVILMNEALIYVAQDYGLEVADWIDRESGDGMYDETLQSCIERLQAADADVILIERQAPRRLVEALEDAGFTVAALDVFSTHREGEGFDTYIQGQLDNARRIADAFERAGNKEAGS